MIKLSGHEQQVGKARGKLVGAVLTIAQLGDDEVKLLDGVDAGKVTAFLPTCSQGISLDFLLLSVNLVTVTCVRPPLMWAVSRHITF